MEGFTDRVIVGQSANQKIDEKLALVAGDLAKILEQIGGQPVAFALFVFPDGEPLYVSNSNDREEIARRIEHAVRRRLRGGKTIIHNRN